MVERCTYDRHPYFPDYGGRGIAVCASWRTFAGFLADMGERPAGMTLDRRDPDGDYEPGNCRWASKWQQRWNRRDMAARRGQLLDAFEPAGATGGKSGGTGGKSAGEWPF